MQNFNNVHNSEYNSPDENFVAATKNDKYH